MSQEVHAYRIVKWWQRHSSAEQRRLGGRAILCPTSHDSLGYRLLVQEPRGVQTFGVYVALAELAGKLPTRFAEHTAGFLANDQGALEVPALSLLIAMPQKVVGAALDRLQMPDIGWVDRVPLPALAPEGEPPDGSREVPVDVTEDNRGSPDPRVPTRGSSSKQSSSEQSALAAAAAALLQRAEVPQSRIAEIVRRGPEPTAIIAHWFDVKRDPRVKRRGGALASRFLGTWEGCPKLTPEAVMEAVRAGVVKSVAGYDVTAQTLKFNAQGLYLEGERIVSADELERVVYG